VSELLLPGEKLPLTPALRDKRLAERLAYYRSLIPPPVTYAQALVEPVAAQVGYQDLIRGDTPAAGDSYRYRVTGDMVVRLLSVLCQLTTSAVVGDRTLTLEYQDDQDVRYLVAGTQAELEASQSQGFCWHPLAGDVAWPVGDVAIAPLPQQMIYPTHSVVLKIGGVQAGDQIDLIRLSVETFETGQT
jgi:hypothetical protein